MLQITPQMKILVAVEPADFRRGIDGLVRHCKDTHGKDPFAGTVFVFRNRRGTAIKVLVYDGQGFWLCHKRLSEGRFRWWPSATDQNTSAKALAAHQLDFDRNITRALPAAVGEVQLARIHVQQVSTNSFEEIIFFGKKDPPAPAVRYINNAHGSTSTKIRVFHVRH